MRSKLKKLVRHFLRGYGYDLVNFSPAHHTLARRARLLEVLNVDLVLDVGANTGQYGAELREIGYQGRIVSFEPVKVAYDQLSSACSDDPEWQARNEALGERDELLGINVSRNLQSSSLLEMLPRHIEAASESVVSRVETVRVRRLDEVIDEVAQGARSIFLKLDTQGFERAVISGAAGCLNRIVAIQAEASLLPLYRGESTLAELIALAEQLDFEVAGIEPGFSETKTGRMLQVDCVFQRCTRLISS